MKQTAIEKEILEIWTSFTTESRQQAVRLDIQNELSESLQKANKDTDAYLGDWITILDEALHFLHLLYNFTSESHKNLDDSVPDKAPSFLFLLSHIFKLVVTIRQLVTSGLGETARPIARSLIETIDLSLVALADKDFANLFLGDDAGYDENEFWKKHIAWGKLHSKLRDILASAGFNSAEQDEFFDARKNDKKGFSTAVHPSISTTFISMLTPHIADPTELRMSIFGNVSAYSPSLIS